MIKQTIRESQELKLLSCAELEQEGGGDKMFKMGFYIQNESRIGPFCLSDKMGSAFIPAKHTQGAFLVVENQAGCILGFRKIGRALHPPKNA